MNKFSLISAIVALSCVITACGSSKSITNDNTTTINTGSTSNTAIVQTIANTTGSWNTLQCNATIKLSGNQSFSSSVNVRMERDKFIYISLRPVLGIEVGRIVLTGDTVIIVDKMHKQYMCENVSLLTNGLPVTISNMQDLFLGRPFTLGNGTYNPSCINTATVVTDNGKRLLRPVKSERGFSYEFAFDSNNIIQSLTVIPDGAQSTQYTVDYSDVRKTVAGNIAHTMSIASTIYGSAFNLGLDYNNITWNQNVNADITIPSNYKRIDASRLSNLLGGGM